MINNAKESILKESFRLFQCVRCHRQVKICTYCDRGNIYCNASCATPARKTSLCSASKRYQHTPHGKKNHACCQKRYREKIKAKSEIVIDQGSSLNPRELCCTTRDEMNFLSKKKRLICDFCGRSCSPYARRNFLNHYRRMSANYSSSSMAFAQGP